MSEQTKSLRVLRRELKQNLRTLEEKLAAYRTTAVTVDLDLAHALVEGYQSAVEVASMVLHDRDGQVRAREVELAVGKMARRLVSAGATNPEMRGRASELGSCVVNRRAAREGQNVSDDAGGEDSLPLGGEGEA